MVFLLNALLCRALLYWVFFRSIVGNFLRSYVCTLLSAIFCRVTGRDISIVYLHIDLVCLHIDYSILYFLIKVKSWGSFRVRLSIVRSFRVRKYPKGRNIWHPQFEGDKLVETILSEYVYEGRKPIETFLSGLCTQQCECSYKFCQLVFMCWHNWMWRH